MNDAPTAERTEDERLAACIASLSATNASLTAERDALSRRVAELRAAVDEAVALDELQRDMAKGFSPRPRDPKYVLTDAELSKYGDLCSEYARRNPLAWTALRSLATQRDGKG